MHAFFERVQGVLKSLHAVSPLTVVPYQLEHIKQAIIARSNVDRIKFIGFKDPNCANGRGEIEGRIDIYEMHEAPYAPPVTVAEVYYLEDLAEPRKRFVVCKEMCQLLWLDAGMRVSTPDTLSELAKLLVLPPVTKEIVSATGQFISEKLAEMAASEILCPFEIRSALGQVRFLLDNWVGDAVTFAFTTGAVRTA